MKHQNIVELYQYTETESDIFLLMEKPNDPGWFEDKIMKVSSALLSGQSDYFHLSETYPNQE